MDYYFNEDDDLCCIFKGKKLDNTREEVEELELWEECFYNIDEY